jgi:hypothetical protein
MPLNPASPLILITTLAEYQTVFWAAIGQELKRQGYAVAYISFDDRSTEMLRSEGLETFATADHELCPVDDAAFEAALQKYGMCDLNYWFAHERITFGITDSAELRRKLLTGLALAERACAAAAATNRPALMVQELGGFLSVIASFFAARAHGIDNWFIEPAFFRGRLLFLKNTFSAQRTDGFEASQPVSDEVREYLKNTLASRAIVVPKKDSHQYTTAFRKIVNLKNLKRLLVKLSDKYIYGKRQEFGYIGRYVHIHMAMLINSLRLSSSYTQLAQLERFVYYPLHVPADMALTLRSTQYLDQLALIAYIARTVPHSHKVVIKEHPAMIGALDASRILELLDCYDNVVMLPPSTNNFDVLAAADAVISVNSKSGAEAVLLGKPVLVLGDAFYRNSPLVQTVECLTDLPPMLSETLRYPPEFSREAVEQYFESVWKASLPGELYVANADNVKVFAMSLLKAVLPDECMVDSGVRAIAPKPVNFQ